MQDDYKPDPNPALEAFGNRLKEKINMDQLVEVLQLPMKLAYYFRHAIYYANGLMEGVLVPADIQQVSLAILRIENEDIPNVPVMLWENREVPVELLKKQAILLLIKATIEGLTPEELGILEKLLKVILKPEDIKLAENIVETIGTNTERKIVFPIDYSTLRGYLTLNKKLLPPS
jgi:hypothetical protein